MSGIGILVLKIIISNVNAADNSTQCEQYTEEDILQILDQKAEEYNIPPWFLKGVAHRESSLNNCLINMDDGIEMIGEGEENWNTRRDNCAFTTDDYPHGTGLYQLTGWHYQGSPYPFCLDRPDNNHHDYREAMRIIGENGPFGEWIKMDQVSRLDDPFDPVQSVDRFITGYALPLYYYFRIQPFLEDITPLEENNLFLLLNNNETNELWRRVAFHWNKGLFVEYDPNNKDYLELYDEHVEMYRK